MYYLRSLCTGNYDLSALDNGMSPDELAEDESWGSISSSENVCGLLLLLERKALKEKRKVNVGF